jgi:hypothetical protein
MAGGGGGWGEGDGGRGMGGGGINAGRETGKGGRRSIKE